MTGRGLAQVDNPSGLFLAERPVNSSGSVVVPCLEGTRPLLVEIQALVAPTPFSGTPRRQATGVDYQRFSIILAVLEKRQGYHLQTQDVFVNVAGASGSLSQEWIWVSPVPLPAATAIRSYHRISL